MTLLASIAGLAFAFVAGVIQGWRWGLDTGHREMAAQANRLIALGRESHRERA